MKKVLILLFFVFLFVSCRVVPFKEAVGENKLIFIGDNHVVVNPRQFLIDNLELLYEAGVRHICMEGFTMRNPENSDYDFYCFFPWKQTGSRYEDVYLSQKINEINALHDSPIILHNPEETLSDNDLIELSLIEKVNVRDEAISKYVSELYSGIDENEKILIFYGYEHGANNASFSARKSMGDILNSQFEDYVSFQFKYGFDQENKVEKQPLYSRYDYLIKQREQIYGIPYQYIFSEENAGVLIHHLLCYLDDQDLFSDDSYDYLSDEREYLSDLYYLSLMYGEKFTYSIWAPQISLQEALFALQLVKAETQSSVTVEQIREYICCMEKSGLDDYLENGVNRKSRLSFIANNLKKAYFFYTDDIWCPYYIGSIELELNHYKEAIDWFKKCLDSPCVANFEALPILYSKLSECYEQYGDYSSSLIYREKGNSLNQEIVRKVSKMLDVK